MKHHRQTLSFSLQKKLSFKVGKEIVLFLPSPGFRIAVATAWFASPSGVIIMSTSKISCDSILSCLTASRGKTTTRFVPAETCLFMQLFL